jgi:HlyD family secretion protein
MKRSNLILLVLGGAAAAGVAAWALQPPVIGVETARATQGAFEQTVSDDGKTRARERYTISAPLSGRVERIRLRAGDRVEKGQEIAVLTPAAPAFVDARAERELRERLGAAEAQHQRSVAEVGRVGTRRDQGRVDLERQQRLEREGFIARAVREQAELQLRMEERSLEAAEFGQEAARHELEQARAALVRYGKSDGGTRWRIASPVGGSVLKVVQESEGVVGTGAPLLEVADPRGLEAVVDVLSQESVAIRPGMPAKIELGKGIAPLAARVRLVEPAAFTKVSALGVEEQRVNVVLDFVDPLDRVQTLGDGFRVDAHIVTQRIDDAVKVPVGALFRAGDGWAVFVVDGAHVRRRVVPVTLRNGVDAVVTGGVKAGEVLVVYPPDKLADGSRVRVLR